MTVEPGPLAKAALAAWTRKMMCQQIADYARGCGLDADWQFVNRHYDWFNRWYYGCLATGYLIRRTGVKRIPPSERKVTQHVNP